VRHELGPALDRRAHALSRAEPPAAGGL